MMYIRRRTSRTNHTAARIQASSSNTDHTIEKTSFKRGWAFFQRPYITGVPWYFFESQSHDAEVVCMKELTELLRFLVQSSAGNGDAMEG